MKTLLPYLFSAGLMVLALASCQKELSAESAPGTLPDHTMQLQFKPVVNGSALTFGTNYVNPFGEQYSVSIFRFYLHAIRLINSDSGKIFSLDVNRYFLVDFADSSSCLLNLAVPSGNYNSLAFEVGVDSALNVSGAQTGALDPANGMFWTWNSGYIMAKLEGNSPVAATPGQKFEFHIGGFEGPDKVNQEISLPLSAGQTINLPSGRSSRVTITADANAWFQQPNDIRISVTPVCTTPGPLARQISENYAGMFTVSNIQFN